MANLAYNQKFRILIKQ